jgi:hypothetical protein
MSTLLTLNTHIPSFGQPGSPVIVVFDNGDWEIAFAGDVDYISEGSSSFFVAVPFTEFFVDLMIFFDLGDVDDLDVMGDTTNIFISENITAGANNEPVLLIWQDKESEVLNRADAHDIFNIDTENVLNFIPVIEIIEDFRKFRSARADAMFEDQEAPIEPDEDADKEDI